MTAINVIQTHDAIFMFSDGSFVDSRTGNLVATGSKVITNVPGRFAVGVSGSQELLRHIGMISNSAKNIEQARGDIEALLPQLFNVIEAKAGAFGIYFAGFSESDERQFWKIEGDLATRVFNTVRVDDDAWHFSPSFTSSALRLAIGEDKANKFDRCFNKRLSVADPTATGMLALDAQRKLPYNGVDTPGGSAAFMVGSFAQVTTITREKVEGRILKRWSDELGQRINPDGAAKVYQSGFGTVSYVPPAPLVGFKGANDTANGILTGSSSNYVVNSSVGYVAPTSSGGTPTIIAYNAAGSTNIGSMTAAGGLAAAFDNVTSQAIAASARSTASGGGIDYIGKDYGSGNTHRIGRFRVFAPNNVNISANSVVPVSQVRLYAKNSAPASPQDGTLLYTATASNTVGEVIDATLDSVTAYRYVWVTLSTTANAAVNDSAVAEVQFYDYSAVVVSSMTLVTTMQTTDASVSNARVLLEYDNSDSPAINTDLTVEVTCNGGTNWTAATLSSVTAYGQGGRKVVETADTACTSGTSFAARIKTLNNKNVPIYGAAVSVH
jgi:hypothetical protein